MDWNSWETEKNQDKKIFCLKFFNINVNPIILKLNSPAAHHNFQIIQIHDFPFLKISIYFLICFRFFLNLILILRNF